MSTRLARIVQLDQAIRSGCYPSASSLAARFEVSERTVYADRTFMVDQLGAPIEFDDERGGWYYADETWPLPAILISEGELLAFFLGEAVSRQYLGTPFEEPLRNALSRMAHYLPDHVQVDLAEAARHYTIRAGARVDVNAQLVLDLEHAIRERRHLRMTYYAASRGERTSRTVDPYHLYNARGDWYLIAHDHLRQKTRNFHLGRIQEWQVLEETFEPDAGFDAGEFLAEGFLTEVGEAADITIRFDGYQARWIRERVWHSSQRVEEQPDGGLILHLHCGGLDEVRRWVMSYGCHAAVLDPPTLRQAVADEVARMAEMYRE